MSTEYASVAAAPEPAEPARVRASAGGTVTGAAGAGLRDRMLFVAACTIAAGVAAFQNLYRLPRAPVLFDEPLYADMGWRYLHWNALPTAEKVAAASNFEHPPLAKLLFGLAQVLVGHPSITAARAVAAVSTLATALVLGLWLARAVNRWVGLLAGALLALIPMAVAPDLTRFGRSAMLDPVAELFMVGSIALGWSWWRAEGRRAWWLALAAGTSAGLASASKENGFLGLVVPMLLALFWLRGGQLARRVAQVVAASLAAAAAFLCCYLPFGQPIQRIGYLFSYQWQHSRDGHLIGLAGQVTATPPWWANFWFAGQGVGSILSWVLPLTAVAAVVLRRDRLTGWLLASLAAPLVFHVLVAGVTLPFYWTLWMPAVVGLSAIGVGELVQLARRARMPATRMALWPALALVLAGLLVPTVAESARVGQLQFEGASTVPAIRSAYGLTGSILTSGTYLPELTPFLNQADILTQLPSDLGAVDTVLIGQPRCRTLTDPAVLAMVAANLQDGALRLARTDRLLRVYVATAPLHAPTAAEISAQPQGQLADNC